MYDGENPTSEVTNERRHQPHHSIAPAGKSAIDRAVLAATIGTYQKLGCWTPHVEITRPAFDVALDVFQHSGLITKRHRYEDVVVSV